MNAFSLVRLAASSAALLTLQAHAANFSFADHITYHTDVVQVSFTLEADTSNVRLWSDSWQGGLNFDPTVTLWVRQGADYSLIGQNDDDASIDPGQGFYDAGLSLPTLAAGQYLLTLGAAPNYAKGPFLSDGFAFDGSTPIQISQWDQPGYDVNANDQKGSFWRLNLSGVDSASPVPEPSALALILAGMGMMALTASRRQA